MTEGQESSKWVVSTYCNSADPGTIARVAEVMGRTVAGLALEGIRIILSVGPDNDEDET